jgi:threonine dehydratase
MDFGKLSQIAQRSAIGSNRRRYLRFHIGEEQGGLLALLDKHFKDVNVSEFLYGKIHDRDAWPVIGLESNPSQVDKLVEQLKSANVSFEDVTLDPDVQYRIINYNPALFKDPVLMHIQFPERRGALRDFMRKISGTANVCYFNYAYSGEAVGRAIMGFEFDNHAHKDQFYSVLNDTPVLCKPIEGAAAARIFQK